MACMYTHTYTMLVCENWKECMLLFYIHAYCTFLTIIEWTWSNKWSSCSVGWYGGRVNCYICVCIYMYACMYVYIYASNGLGRTSEVPAVSVDMVEGPTATSVCVYIGMHACMYGYACMYVWYPHIHAKTYMHLCMIHLCVYIYVCMYVWISCIKVCVCSMRVCE